MLREIWNSSKDEIERHTIQWFQIFHCKGCTLIGILKLFKHSVRVYKPLLWYLAPHSWNTSTRQYGEIRSKVRVSPFLASFPILLAMTIVPIDIITNFILILLVWFCLVNKLVYDLSIHQTMKWLIIVNQSCTIWWWPNVQHCTNTKSYFCVTFTGYFFAKTDPAI